MISSISHYYVSETTGTEWNKAAGHCSGVAGHHDRARGCQRLPVSDSLARHLQADSDGSKASAAGSRTRLRG